MSEQDTTPETGAGGPGRIPTSLAVRAVSVTAAGALLLGLIVGPIISGHPTLATDPTTPEHNIAVGGAGVVSVTPDVSDVVLGVWAEQPTAKAARDAAASSMTAVVAAVKKQGIDDKDIVTVNISLDAVYDYSSQKARLTGYRFTNNVKVTVRDLTKLAGVVDDAVSAGATNIQGISFRLSDPKGAQAQARELAMADARSKADALAKAAGVTIKGVATVSEVSYTPPSPVAYDVAKAAGALQASTPIQTGTTDVQVQVSVTYLI